MAGRCLASFATSAITSIASLVGAYLILGPILNTGIPFAVNPLSAVLLLLALVVNVLAAMGLGLPFERVHYFRYEARMGFAHLHFRDANGLLGRSFSCDRSTLALVCYADVLSYAEFIRAARLALIPNTPGSYFYYLGLSFLGGMVLLALGLVAYRAAEERARRMGLVDRKTV